MEQERCVYGKKGPEYETRLLKIEVVGTHSAIESLIGKGQALSYFNQTNLFKKDGIPQYYLIFNPNPSSPDELSEDQLSLLQKKIGPDFFRLRAVSGSLLQKNSFPLAVGGSCAIETWGVRLINALGKGNDETKASLAEFLLSLAPTMTHATGAILPAGELGVHLIEDALWGQRIEDTYGVEKGRKKTEEAYERIHRVAARRCQLATGNPYYRLIPIKFEELDLLEHLKEWFKQMGIDFDPQFGIAQVIYTYVGPNLLTLLKKALRKSGLPNYEIDPFNMACRLKQIDHNDWDATMAELKGIILGETPNDKQKSLLEKYPFRAGLTIAKWVRENYEKNPSQPSGFFDFPYDGKILHMAGFHVPTNDPGEIANKILSIKNDPRLLRFGNLDQHLDYLDGYLKEEFNLERGLLNEKREASQQLQKLQSSKQSLEAKIQNYKKILEMYGKVLELLNLPDDKALDQEEKEKFRPSVQYLTERYNSFFNSLIKRYPSNIETPFSFDSLSQNDREDLHRWRNLFLFLRKIGFEELGEKLKELNQIFDKKSKDNEERDIQKNEEDWKEFFINKVSNEIRAIEEDLENKKNQLSSLMSQLKSLDKKSNSLDNYPPPSIFPLERNLIIMHATQFVFDPDFRAFLRYVANVKNSDKDQMTKKAEIREACKKIFPKLKAYLVYIFAGGDYPYLRNMRIFDLS
ncbi:MAG: hypothetical protein NZL96_03545 [Patescibacteria group bacterium]|nr:hypothetical protein [Patescibacteria group bacterium]